MREGEDDAYSIVWGRPAGQALLMTTKVWRCLQTRSAQRRTGPKRGKYSPSTCICRRVTYGRPPHPLDQIESLPPARSTRDPSRPFRGVREPLGLPRYFTTATSGSIQYP